MSRYSHLSEPDPEWAQLATMLPPPPETRPSIEEQRQMLRTMALASKEREDIPYPKFGLTVAETSVPVDGESITVRTYVPEATAGETRFPLLVWCHGGGFSAGDLETDDTILRIICVNQRISCVNVGYRLAPEHPFPIPGNDCYCALKWAAANTDSLSADLAKGFIVGGASAGANLAAVSAIKARDDPSFKTKLTGQILQIPCLCAPAAYPEKWKSELLSIDQNQDAPIINKKGIQMLLETYGPPDLTDPEFAPLLAASHANLPALYIQICGLDPFRDEAFLYEKIIGESGTPTKHDVYPGQPHGFYGIGPHMAQSKKWTVDTQKGVEWLLQQK